ncbi:MAG: hypothetical protein Q7T33_05810 [Dehalococcoidia bacterium]|nr:hypothetical protein [Dehalococcoidia bacterium]
MTSSGTNDIMAKFRALSNGEKVILIAGVVLLIVGFLPWYHAGGGTIEVGGIAITDVPSVNRSGWQSPGAIWSMLAILIGLASAGVVLVKNLAKAGTLPDNIGGMTWPKIHLGAGAAAALFVIIKLLNHSGDLGFGFYLGIICVAALAGGGFLMYRDEMASSSGPPSSGASA